jgi:hypothetical protein
VPDKLLSTLLMHTCVKLLLNRSTMPSLFTRLRFLLVAVSLACLIPHVSIAASEVTGSKKSTNPSAPALPTDIRGTKPQPLVIESVESAKDAAEKREQARYRVIDSMTAQWAMWLTAGMLVVASIQALFFWVQLHLMRKSMKVAEVAATAAERSVETMQDTARRQLRAYVSIDRAWIEFLEPGVPKVTVVVKNAGLTPAHNLRHWIHQWIERYPLTTQLPTPPNGFVTSSSVLGSGATHNMQIKHPQPIINPSFIDKIGTSEGTIYVYGEIHYKDVFGHEHITKYRLMHGGPEKSSPGVLSPCEDGNEAS